MTVSERFCEREKETLSPEGISDFKYTRTRYILQAMPEQDGVQRDRDRILHSKSFRRLMHKTQVFLFPVDEHYRTRMTHTLEVTQIARIIARALMLNEDLCEAAALGHDLGHTPFGHAGEDVMQKCFSPDFTHYKRACALWKSLKTTAPVLTLHGKCATAS